MPSPPMPPYPYSHILHHIQHDGSNEISYFPPIRVRESTPETLEPLAVPRKPSHRQKCSKWHSSSPSQSGSPRPQLRKKGLGDKNILNSVRVTACQAKVKFQSFTMAVCPNQ